MRSPPRVDRIAVFAEKARITRSWKPQAVTEARGLEEHRLRADFEAVMRGRRRARRLRDAPAQKSERHLEAEGVQDRERRFQGRGHRERDRLPHRIELREADGIALREELPAVVDQSKLEIE